MFFLGVLAFAVILSIASPRAATAAAWGLTLLVNVPLIAGAAGSFAWLLFMPFGLTSFTLASYLTCLVAVGGPVALAIVAFTFSD